jgi:squalene-hopene/tetraprenyl-beta-curcumene cyclase
MQYPREQPTHSPDDRLLDQAILRARFNLTRLQHPDGYWAGELMADATLCADYVLYMHWSDRVDPVLEEKCAAHVRRRQLDGGGWAIYPGGPTELNASIKAYTSLKLAGVDPDEPSMQTARATILQLGGVPRANTYTKFYLALINQFPWGALPAIPPELVLLPTWLPFHLYRLSSWSRAILVPLSIIRHHRPTRAIPPSRGVPELFPLGPDAHDLRGSLPWSIAGAAFYVADKLIKCTEHLRWFPVRSRALAEAERWMTARMGEGSDGLAAVFPAMLNAIMALECLGRPQSDPLLKKAKRDLESLFVDDPSDFRIQPCLSPVWDTAINIIALVEAGTPSDDPAIRSACEWLSNREVQRCGDWVHSNSYGQASGWAFEFQNDWYPDTDDTAMVLMALRFNPALDDDSSPAARRQFERALRWLLSFQCSDGGWAAFDRELTDRWLESVPFADHNAILDPTCSDLTGRTLELLGYIGCGETYPPARRAIEYLRATQEPDGSWYGRWGVNYIYGAWQVLRGLRAIGVDMEQPWITRARDWLRGRQNADGGWGESCASYESPSARGRGPSTASQTAWALMGLIAAGDIDTPVVEAGINFLLRTQHDDGSWSESQITGTGFPRVFYLKYDMYRDNFPLLALATYRHHRAGSFHAATRFHVAGRPAGAHLP